MSNLYGQKMIEMANRIGQPQVTTTTATQKQPLDVGTLLMLLMSSNLFGKKPAGQDVSGLDMMPQPQTMGTGWLGNMGAAGAIPGLQTASTQMTPEVLMQLLSGFRGR